MTQPHDDRGSIDMDAPIGCAYLAPEGLESVLQSELASMGVHTVQWHGRLAITQQPPLPCRWILDRWDAPERHNIQSIGDAASLLRGRQRNWAHYAHDFHRRSSLIAERLPPIKVRPLTFGEEPPTSHLGAWTLLGANQILFSATKTSPFANGEIHFVENRDDPPSRAYLKLWEALTQFGRRPGPGDNCLDLGASPGGWTWVLASLGANVTSIDRSALAPNVAAMPEVTFREASAFGIDPELEPPVDWLCSDIIAYPARLLALTRRWIASRRARNILLTIKFQGETDHSIANAFAAIEGSRVIHLWHNKHELTFFWSDPSRNSR